MIAVMGATGNVGRQICERLLQNGRQVRALGRNADKLAALEARGAAAMSGEARDAAFLASAFRGIEAVHTLLPPDLQAADLRRQHDEQGAAIVEAIRASAVRHVVFLSSVGADLPAGTGPIAHLHAQEERLRRLPGVNVLVLRAGYFFENFYDMLGLIKHQGINGGAVAPGVSIPMIATRDIAEAAAAALERRDWTGYVVRELLGPRDLTFAEATRIIGSRLGKPDLPYVQLPYEQLTASLVQMGVSPSVAELYTELSRALTEGKVVSQEGRRPQNTTPTGFEAFADELARAYEAV